MSRYILSHHKEYGLPVSTEPPQRPAGGTLYLFDKKQERYFRKDGHQWRKKANGKTVRETHEKLKVSLEVLSAAGWLLTASCIMNTLLVWGVA